MSKWISHFRNAFCVWQTRTCKAANCSFSSSAHNVFKLTDVPLIVVPVMLMLALLLIPLLLVVLLRIVSPNGFAVGPLHDANKLKRCLFKSFDSNVAQLSTETDYGNEKCSIQSLRQNRHTNKLFDSRVKFLIMIRMKSQKCIFTSRMLTFSLSVSISK